jgi:WD40 repeat protein
LRLIEVLMFSYRSLLSPVLLLPLGGSASAAPLDRFGDPLPEGAIARLGSLRLRHEHFVCVADFSPDGKMLAAADDSRFIVVWDTATGREVRRVRIDLRDSPRCIRYCDGGKSLVLASRSGDFCVIDAVTGAERQKLKPLNNDLRAVAISRDGGTAITLYNRDSVVVWDLAGGKRLRQFPIRTKLDRHSRNGIALTPDGKQLVLPYADGSLHLLNATTGKEVLAIEMPPVPPKKPLDSYSKVTISPNGRYLAYGGPSKSATLCDLTTGKRLREVPPLDSIDELIFTPDSRMLAVADSATIRFFDVRSGKETRTWRKPWPSRSQLVFSPDGRKVADIPGTPCILLWDVVAGKLLHPPVGHPWFIRQLHFFPDGKRLVSNTSIRGEMIVWDIAASRPLAAHHTGQLQRWIAVAGDGKSLQFLDFDSQPKPWIKSAKNLKPFGKTPVMEEGPRPSGTDYRSIRRWNLVTDREAELGVLSTSKASDWFVLSPDGRRSAVVTLGTEPRVELSDGKGDKPAVLAALPNKGQVYEIAFAPDGRRLLVDFRNGFPHGFPRVLDGATGQLVREIKPDKPERLSCSDTILSDDGRCVALYDGRLCIREIASGRDRLQIPTAEQPTKLALSPDGRFLVSLRSDGSIFVFSTATGKQLARWQSRQGSVNALAFNPDGRSLGTGGMDGTILIWKLPENDGLPAILSAKEAGAFWQTLADTDASRANRALAVLVAAPTQAIPIIEKRFRVTGKRLPRERLLKLVADLDNDAFKIREKSARELTEAGPDAILPLRKGLANNPSVEAKGRMEGLLNRLNEGGDPEHLRCLRAIEVLERIGTPQAKNALGELARKPLPADLADEMQASLRRMGERP